VNPGFSTTNGAGQTNSIATLTATVDNTAPTGGALTVEGVSATSAATPPSDYSTSSSFTISVANYTDAGSGMASNTLVRTSGTYNPNDGTCGTFGSSLDITGRSTESSLSDGCYKYTLTGTDNVGKAAAAISAVVMVDTQAPQVTAVALANGTGTANKADNNDTVTITYSENVAPTICSSWTATSQTQLSGNGQVTVTITDNGSNDLLSVSTASGCTPNVGSVALGADYVSGTATFSGSGSGKSTIGWSATNQQLTISLGAVATGSGNVRTGVTAGKPSYTPASGIADLAGNSLSTGTFTSGSATGF
jgi:hypothetical protein